MAGWRGLLFAGRDVTTMEKIPMTAAGFKGLEDELNRLKN